MAFVLGALVLGLAFHYYDRQRIKVSHVIVPGDSFAPYGPDASFALKIANHGYTTAEGLLVELRWLGMSLDIKGGDSETLKEAMPSFGRLAPGQYRFNLKRLEPGRVAFVMFSARIDKVNTATPAEAASAFILGRGFRSKLVTELPSLPEIEP